MQTLLRVLRLDFLPRRRDFALLLLRLWLGLTMLLVHKASLEMGPGSGELAFIYLAGFVALILAGRGRWLVDARVCARGPAGRV